MATPDNPNIFTPPSSCLDNLYTAYPLGGDAYSTLSAGSPQEAVIAYEGYSGLDYSCFPSAFSTTYFTPQITQYPLSPATCPSGYSNVAQSVTVSRPNYNSVSATAPPIATITVATCCRGGMTFIGPQSTSSYWACYSSGQFSVITEATATAGPSTSVETTTSIIEDGVVWAPKIIVTWQSSDQALFALAEPTPPESTETATPSFLPPDSIHSGTSTTDLPAGQTAGSSSDLTTGQTAGIAVGATLGGCILIAIAGIFWWRRRKAKAWGRPPVAPPRNDVQPEMPVQQIQPSYSAGMYELPTERKISEAPDFRQPPPRAELEGA